MTSFLRSALAAACLLAAGHASAQITFYEHEGYQGRSFSTERAVRNFNQYGFNDRASSVMVAGQRWEVCQDERFSGPCRVLRPGRYASLAALGLNDRVSSARAVRSNARYDEDRYAPAPLESHYDARRRNNERLFRADVTSARAVLGPAEQRCWVERERVSDERRERGSANVPGALAGALIGGILGHQVGGGSGRDLATAGGVVAGAAIGSNVGRDRDRDGSRMQDVRRCETVPAAGPPQYWDVSYRFRGVDHRMQMTTAPGPTVLVNRRGEPRA